jgi:hypothetical protein
MVEEKPFCISKWAVWEAWTKVRANRGAADVLVIRVGEHMVGLKVRKLDLQRIHGIVDVAIDAQPHGQIVSQRQPAVRRDLASLLNLKPDLPVADRRPHVVSPQHRLILMTMNLAGARTLANAAGSGRMLHLKGLLAMRSLLSAKPQYIAA